MILIEKAELIQLKKGMPRKPTELHVEPTQVSNNEE